MLQPYRGISVVAIARSHWNLTPTGLLGPIVLALVLVPSVTAAAAPRRFDCSLNQIETMVGANFDAQAENRTIAVVIDDQSQTITVYQDGSGRTLGHVTITQIAMNGYTDDMSLGIQTSSGNIVLQSYAPNSSKAEFGTCSQSKATTTR